MPSHQRVKLTVFINRSTSWYFGRSIDGVDWHIGSESAMDPNLVNPTVVSFYIMSKSQLIVAEQIGLVLGGVFGRSVRHFKLLERSETGRVYL